MDTEILSLEDLNIIKQSLMYTKLNFENYTKYPSLDLKKTQIDGVLSVIKKVDARIKSIKN